LTGASLTIVAGTSRRAGRVTTSNAVSARADATAAAPVGNSIRNRWSFAVLSTGTAKPTRGERASRVASIRTGAVTSLVTRLRRSEAASAGKHSSRSMRNVTRSGPAQT